MLSRHTLAGVLVALCLCLLAAGPASAQEATVKVIEPWARADKPLTDVADLQTITLAAPCNGFASGVVAIQAPAELPGVRAAVSALKGPGGATLPAAAINVRYGKPESAVYGLQDTPLATPAAKQVVWVRANIPENATPGAYTGTLAITGLSAPLTVPVALTVYNWRVGSPAEWQTSANFLQSPESLAGWYQVPMWSDQHFKLIEKSMELMAECGNDVLGVQAVGPSYWGDDPVIVFRKTGNTYTPDFTYLERYLTLYDRIVGKPKYLAVQVWSWNERGPIEPGTQPVMIHVLDGNTLVRTALPAFGAPGTEELWKATLEGVRERVRKLGWRDDHILLGTAGDSIPLPATIDFFKRVAPWAAWRVLTHGTGCPKWGTTVHKRVQPNGMLVDYLEIARWVGNGRAHAEDHPVVSNCRDHVGTEPFALFALTPFCAMGGYEGFGDKGLDYWTYTTQAGQKRNALNSYLVFGNVIGGTPRAISSPGPDGAMRTPETEMIREGIQAQEAIYRIQANLRTLNPTPARQCDMAEIFLQGALHDADEAPARARELEISLVFDGDTILVRPYAPRWNSGGIGTGNATAQVAKDGAKFSVDFALRDDQWVKGGSGHFDVAVVLKDGEYTGTFTGQFRGVETSGTVRGSYQPHGFTIAAGPPPPKTDLQLRSEAAIAEFQQAICLDKQRGNPALRPQLRQLLTRIYALAEETTAAIAAK